MIASKCAQCDQQLGRESQRHNGELEEMFLMPEGQQHVEKAQTSTLRKWFKRMDSE